MIAKKKRGAFRGEIAPLRCPREVIITYGENRKKVRRGAKFRDCGIS